MNEDIMKQKSMRRLLIAGLLILFFYPVPLVMGQEEALEEGTTQALPTVNNLFTIWAKLSLSGYSQSEIESRLENIDPEGRLLERVKRRMRLNVIKNLNRMNVKAEIANSTTVHDLRVVTNTIRMEVRFSGMENDHRLRIMIRNNFGISLSRI